MESFPELADYRETVCAKLSKLKKLDGEIVVSIFICLISSVYYCYYYYFVIALASIMLFTLVVIVLFYWNVLVRLCTCEPWMIFVYG